MTTPNARHDAGSGTLSRAGLGWLILAALISTVAGTAVGSVQPSGAAQAIYFVLLFAIALALVAGGVLSARRRGFLDFASPTVFFPLMFLIVYGVGGTLYLDSSRYPRGSYLLFVILLGILGYLAGLLLAKVIKIGESLKFYADSPAWSPDAVAGCTSFAVSRVLFAMGVLGMLGYWASSGGIPILSGDLENARVASLSGSGVPYYFSLLLMPAAWYRMAGAGDKLSKADVSIVACGSLLLISTGWRNAAVGLLIVAVLIRYYRKPFRRSVVIIGGVVLLLGVSALGLYRVYSSRISTYQTYRLLANGDVGGALWSYLQTYPQSFNINFAQVVQGVPGLLEYQKGRSFLWNLQLLVPSNDAQAYDFVLKESLRIGFEGGGLPPTLFGEFYLNFGLTGVFVCSVLFGVAVKHVHARFSLLSRLAGEDTRYVLYAMLLYYLSVSIRGGLENITLTVLWLLVAITLSGALGHRLMIARRPRSRPSGFVSTTQRAASLRRL